VKTLEWTTDGSHLAVGTYSLNVSVLSTPSLSSNVSLRHMKIIEPISGLKIWQEEISHSLAGHYRRGYILATQSTCPPQPTSPTGNDSGLEQGINTTQFDSSGTLLATISETMPTAVWIWDLASKILKAVLVHHSPIAKISWNPSTPELLMIRCEGDECKALTYLWEPSWESPRILDFGSCLPEGKIIGRSIIRWLTTDKEANMPAIFFSNSQDCVLASFAGTEIGEEVPWQDAVAKDVEIFGQLEESPLDLMSGSEKLSSGKAIMSNLLGVEMNFDVDDMDDTFDFRN